MYFKEHSPKNTLTVLALLLLVMLSSACVPEKAGSSRRSSSASNAGSVDQDNSAGDPTFANEKLYWYVEGQTVEANVSINENIQSVLYLGGKSINAFLKVDGRDTKTYCLVASYNISDGSAKGTLRARAIPISITNFSTRTIERRFRIDISEQGINQSTCGGIALKVDTNGNTTTNLEANASFSPQTLCTNCTSIVNSTNVSIYLKNGVSLVPGDRIENTYLELSPLSLKIDTKNTISDPVGQCSNTECQARGYSCCLTGQCVMDGAVRPNASLEDNYQQAINDVALNPSLFINYPNVYFVCGAGTIPTPAPTPTPDPTASADAAFERLKKEYYCLEQGPLGDFSNCDPSQDYTSFTTIRESVWTRCGCTLPTPIDVNDPRCPNFGLKAEFDNLGTIKAISCKIPNPTVEPTPFQNLTLAVPSRSVPHRFYSSAGANIDDLETVKNQVPKVVVEGDEFMYLDPVGKTDPIGLTYNINSILGQMKVELNSAVPAKMLNVEFDQTYVISTVSGYYTPCPQCTSDGWFESFKAHPSTTGGAGLRAVGHTTTRDEFGLNSTYGNYEDTNFGRACFLPPTMIPLSHRPDASLNAQRRNRLSTQAAYFINGYKKDWFGFNKGAVIGSFDGVTWFAIGSGRRVTATSNKLFIAVNNPYADLADRTDFIVNIVTDLGNNVVSNIDYDPELRPNHPEQNTGATCQQYHQCNVDTDCITKLGWEYTCADISYYKSTLPKFNINAVEQSNEQIANATFDLILQGFMPQGSSKRCVYRGAGAPCKKNTTTGLITNNSETQKLLTCAPNFYCASADEAAFNSEIARTPNNIDIYLLGQESNVLGRPLHYIGAQNTLPNEVRQNLLAAAGQILTDTSDFGMCRPGKRLASGTGVPIIDPLVQHQSADPLRRTDYISQIGSCNSAINTANRIAGCPVIETRDNQAVEKGDLLRAGNTLLGSEQNMCGGESRVSGTNESTFKLIEAGRLDMLYSIGGATLVADACLRKAGSVCHTDLDCGPNKLHAEQAAFLGVSYFGGTEAEQRFWQEPLVCSQANPKPVIDLNSDSYYEYDLTQNRCCRAIGNEFTMYTEGPSEIVTSNGSQNSDLVTDQIPNLGTSITGRYSRYAVVDVGNFAPSETPLYQKPAVAINATPKKFQWKTMHDTGEKTCCGGGWIRKFADGSTDWSRPNRLTINMEALSCLNYSYDAHNVRPNEVYQNNYIADSDGFCLSPAFGGCVQSRNFNMGISYFYSGMANTVGPANPGVLDLASTVSWNSFDQEGFQVRGPQNQNITHWFMDTSPLQDPRGTVDSSKPIQSMSIYAPYIPKAYKMTRPDVEDGPYTFFGDPDLHYGVSLYMPAYLGASMSDVRNILGVYIKYYKDGKLFAVKEAFPAKLPTGNPYDRFSTDVTCPGTIGDNVPEWPYPGAPYPDNGNNIIPEGHWCISYDNATANRKQIFHIVSEADLDANPTNGPDWDYAGVIIKFNPMGTPNYISNGALLGTASSGMAPGNALHYLTKLSRLELLGIPQIAYEPLYCNTDRSKLVEGIFNSTVKTRTQFEDPLTNFSFNYSALTNNKTLSQIYDSTNAVSSIDNPSNRVVFQDKIELEKIFSENEFRCCRKANSVTTSSNLCCSGHSVVVDNQRICKLPRGTNLNVYFNRFVSSEGTGEDLPSGGFVDADFIPETGEPKLNQDVNNKIAAIGAELCESGNIRQGASFGYFNAEPNDGYYRQPNLDPNLSRYFGIVDSIKDEDVTNGTGAIPFLAGFRWDHQFYCAD